MKRVLRETEDTYKTISYHRIGKIQEQYIAELLETKADSERQSLILMIVGALESVKKLREEYDRLAQKQDKTDFDLEHLEELDEKIRQSWILYLNAKKSY